MRHDRTRKVGGSELTRACGVGEDKDEFRNRGHICSSMGREINDTRTRVNPFVVFFPDGLFSFVDSLFGYSLGDKQSALPRQI